MFAGERVHGPLRVITCVFVCPSVCTFLWFSLGCAVCLSVCLSVYIFLVQLGLYHLSVCPCTFFWFSRGFTVCLSVRVCFCGSLRVLPSVCVSVRVHFCTSVRVMPSVCLLSVSLSMYIFLVLSGSCHLSVCVHFCGFIPSWLCRLSLCPCTFL